MLKSLRFATIILNALATGLLSSHLLEMPQKLKYTLGCTRLLPKLCTAFMV